MPTLKEYKTKLHSLKNTKKMTHTMKLVSASKLRQVHRAQANAKAYAQELTSLIARLVASVESASHPLLAPRQDIKNILILVITSDKGLCGGFNNNLNKKVFQWIQANQGKYAKVELSFCGKRGFMFFKNRGKIKIHYENVTGKPDFVKAQKIGEELSRSFVDGEYDEIYLAYNHFTNPLSQTPSIEKFLPIEAENLLQGGQRIPSYYIFEPPQDELLGF